MILNEDPAVESLWWLLDRGGIRLWGESGPSRWAHGRGSSQSQSQSQSVHSWWEYIQLCLEARAAGCVGQPREVRRYVV